MNNELTESERGQDRISIGDTNLILLSSIIRNLIEYNNAIDKEYRRLESNNDAFEDLIKSFQSKIDDLCTKTKELTEYHAMNCLKRFFEESLKKACSYNKEDENGNVV
jgi:hypothetical protein